MATQIEFNFTAPNFILKDVKVGEHFMLYNTVNSDVYKKVAPVKSLVRSTMVHEILTRGDCFVVSINTGLLTVISYNTPVTSCDVKLIVSPTYG